MYSRRCQLRCLALAWTLSLAGIAAAADARPSVEVWHFDPDPAAATRAQPAPHAAGNPNPGFVRSVWEGASSEMLGTADTTVSCVGDGISGKRIEVLYAHPSDYANRFSTYAAPIQILAANINREVMASAGETRGNRQIRFVHNSACRPVVRNVTLGLTSASTDFNDISSDLHAKGFNRSDRIYLVYLDGDVSTGGIGVCGIAGGISAGYAMVKDSCWSDVDDHELAHAFSAVHFTAPNSGGDGHCTDNYDVLCFTGFFTPSVVTYPCPIWHRDLLDCRHDDYFHTSPPAGSFLRNHPESNTAHSPFLVRTAAPPNDGFARATPVKTGIVWGSNVGATAQAGEPATAGSAPAHSIWFRIRSAAGHALALETYASSANNFPVDTVLGVYRGTSLGTLTLVAQNDNARSGVTYSRVGLVTPKAPAEGTTYYVRVDGKNGAVGSIRLNVLNGSVVPSLASFSPANAAAPTEITLNGTGLLGEPGSPFGTRPGVNGTGYSTAASGTNIYKITPAKNAVPGPVTLSTSTGAVQTDTPWRLLPKIVSFSPSSGSASDLVQVRGTGFASGIKPAFRIGGVLAPIEELSVDYDASFVAQGFIASIRVPAGAASGKISVRTTTGVSNSAADFVVAP